MKTILVLNCGSSSIKFALIHPSSESISVTGIFEQINSAQSTLIIEKNGIEEKYSIPNASYHDAFINIKKILNKSSLLDHLTAIGHRVVHGGNYFNRSCIITTDVLKKISICSPLAPLHNPANIEGIEFCHKLFPFLQQVAVFDTAFHQSIPEEAYTIALPQALCTNQNIRKYGFHGTSYHYVSLKISEILNLQPKQGNFIMAHLGNGCSVTAIKHGKSVDTTMGLTPLDGVVMGTRSGSIDPGIFNYLNQQLNLDVKTIDEMLNNKSGLFGICGISDMREIELMANDGNKRAKLAIEVFSLSIAKAICSLSASLNEINALVFTGGIGENSSKIRQRIISRLNLLGFQMDKTHNNNNGSTTSGSISTSSSRNIYVIPTCEEVMIAKETFAITQKGKL